MSYLSVHGLGNLTRDPEIKNAGTEKAVCNFAVAVNRRVAGEEKATFLECKAFGKTADNIAKFFGSGQRIIIASGELEEQRWEDKTTGAKRSKLVCIVARFDFPERASARDESVGDHGEAAARDNFRNDAPKPHADRDAREQRSAQKQAAPKQQEFGETRPLDTYGDEDVPF